MTAQRRPKGRTVLQQAFEEMRFGASRTLNLRPSLPTASEAATRVERWVREHHAQQSGELLVVTGRGNNSEGGVSRVRESTQRVLHDLRRKGVVANFSEHNAGAFVVTLAPFRAMFEAASRRREMKPLPAPANPATLAVLDDETKLLLRTLADRSLDALGVRDRWSYIEGEMLRLFGTLAGTVQPGPDRESHLRNAIASALRESTTDVEDSVQFALVTFASVLFIVDPIAVIPTYLVITQGQGAAQRRATARRACMAAAILLVVFALAGSRIFGLFGITMPAFRIAGGLILWLVAMDMLHGTRSTQEGTAEITEGQAKDDVALTPLAMPMLAGPGAISTVMVLAGQARTTAHTIIVYASIVVTLLLSWITLRLAEWLVARMGQTGIRVMTRIMGLLLAAIAVQFVITGAKEALGR